MNNKDYTDEQWGTHIFRYSNKFESQPTYIQKRYVRCINYNIKRSMYDKDMQLTCNEIIIKSVIE